MDAQNNKNLFSNILDFRGILKIILNCKSGYITQK